MTIEDRRICRASDVRCRPSFHRCLPSCNRIASVEDDGLYFCSPHALERFRPIFQTQADSAFNGPRAAMTRCDASLPFKPLSIRQTSVSQGICHAGS